MLAAVIRRSLLSLLKEDKTFLYTVPHHERYLYNMKLLVASRQIVKST
jgi:hypothetical protein